jgi:dTDP-4-dehydrorhamnose reductase
MSRWMITGSGGMLGRDLLAMLATNGADVVGLRRRELDITDEAAVRAALRDCRPDVVVNCAAWTAVDDAESHEVEAFDVNARGAAHLAAACAHGHRTGQPRLVHMSTDYVFAGDSCADRRRAIRGQIGRPPPWCDPDRRRPPLHGRRRSPARAAAILLAAGGDERGATNLVTL